MSTTPARPVISPTERDSAGDGRPESPPSIRHSHSRGFGMGFVIKLVLMALINAFGLFGILSAWAAESWGILVFLLLALIAADLVYFLPTRRMLPAKYLYPGLIFLLVFQIFVVLYTAATAFTNYGDGHNSTKQAAVNQLTRTYEQRVAGGQEYPVSVLNADGDLALATVQDGRVLVGSAHQALSPVEGATVTNGAIDAVPGYDILDYGQVTAAHEAVMDLRVPEIGRAHV